MEFVKLIDKTLIQAFYHLIQFPKALTDFLTWPRVHTIYLQNLNRQQFRKEPRGQRLKRKIAQLQGIFRGALGRKLMQDSSATYALRWKSGRVEAGLAQWSSTFLMCMRLWVGSPALKITIIPPSDKDLLTTMSWWGWRLDHTSYFT